MSEVKNENIGFEQQNTCDCKDCNCGESIPNSEELLNLLAVQEEEKRIEKFESDFEVSEKTKASDLYKEGMVVAETIISMTKTLVNAGVDYNNGLSLVSNFLTNKQNLELAKVQQIQAQQNQI
jgi:hypothetical protein